MTNKFLIASFLVLVFFLVGRTQKHRSHFGTPGPLLGLVKEPFAKNEASPEPIPEKPHSPSESAKLLREGNGGELFRYLFDQGFKRHGEFSAEHFKAVRARFATPYPHKSFGHFDLGKREAVHRIGILKAMGESARYIDPSLRSEIVKFYQKILKDPREAAMIKRQALRSLMQTQPEVSESEHVRRIANVDRHVLSLSALTDRELLEVVFEK